jgi:Calx-beta domain-containing protein/subtilase family protein/VCBS repeat protein
METVTEGALSKLDSQLAALHLSHAPTAAAAASFISMVQQFAGSVSADGRSVLIDATAADGHGATLLDELLNIGLVGGASFGAMASGWLPIDQIKALTELPGLGFARESLAMSHAGSVTTQADRAMAADTARTSFSVDGSGIKVGVLSDSFNSHGGMNGDIATNDLPANTTILQDMSGTDEGRAMAQLVHDVAPGSSIVFATAFGGQANFANNIIALKNAGAKVIVDDVGYFAEPMFQDGVIAQAVDQVVAAGAVYFSSAGNSGHKGYEAGYLSVGTTQTINGKAETWHNYNSGSPTIFMPFTLANNGTATIVLEWNQPAASVSPGHGASSDLDLVITDNSASHFIVGLSQSNNIGNDPIEVVQFSNTSGSTQTYDIVVGLASGAAPSDMKIVTFNGNGSVGNGFASNSNDGTVYGHAAAANAIAVGAASYAQTPAFGISPPVVENFSSGGPTRIFFDTAGNPISVVRQTPQITAPDGGNTTFFGSDDADADSLPNFYGTSAAAPDAAAVAALMLQANGSLSASAIKNALMNSAIDMNNPATPGFDTGFDFGTGAGLIQADKALQAIAISPGSVSIGDVTVTEGDSGTKLATFTVTRTGGTAAFSVNYATTNGSATAPSDYVAVAGTLNFASGINTQTIAVTINGDTTVEPDETFFVNLLGATNGVSIGDALGVGTIANDDHFLPPVPPDAAPADFNSDVKADILWRNDNGTVALWTMNGAQKAADQVVSPLGNDWHLADTADFNADGKTDILWRNDSGAVAVWTMNGAQKLADQVVSNMGNDWRFINAADFNADGKADILWRHDSGTVAIWTMNGGQKAADQVVSRSETTGMSSIPPISTATARPISSGATTPVRSRSGP